MQLERQRVRRKVYLAQVAVERGGAPLDGARVARRVAHDSLPLAQVERPVGLGLGLGVGVGSGLGLGLGLELGLGLGLGLG